MKHTDDFKQFIAQKAFEKWADTNKTFIEDIQELVHQMIMFEVKYGTRILYEIDKTPTEHGRELGKEFVDITSEIKK